MKRLRRWLEKPWIVWVAVALGVLLTLPSLWGGLYFDDYILRIARLGHPDFPETPTFPLDLFTFTSPEPAIQFDLTDRLIGIWALSEDLRVSFMRPLSSLTHSVDFWLWPDAAWLMHLQSVFWYALLVYLVSRYYRSSRRQEYFGNEKDGRLIVGWRSLTKVGELGTSGFRALRPPRDRREKSAVAGRRLRTSGGTMRW